MNQSAWTCKFCETANTWNDLRCVVCDQERPAPDDGSPVGVSSPADAGAAREATRSQPGRTRAWFYGAGTALVLVLVAGAVLVLTRSSDATSTSSSATVDATARPSRSTSTSSSVVVTTSTTSTAPPPTETVLALPTTTPAPVPTPAPTTPKAATDPPTGGGPVGGGGAAPPVEGGWTAILLSCDVAQNCIDAAQAWRSFAPTATAIPKGTYESLRPYWVVAAGSFSSSGDAIGYCLEIGRPTKKECFARYLSHDPADLTKIVYPD